MPTDLILRNVQVGDAEALAHILVTSITAAFRNHVPDHCLDFPEAESAANWRRSLTQGLPPGDFLTMIQRQDGNPVGYAWGGPYDDPGYQGELRQIAILPAEQGKGIGRILVRHVASRLAAQDIWSMRVDVLKSNPHRGFYERLGGQFLFEHPYDWDGVILPSCVYGWKDIRSLLSQQGDGEQ